MTHTRSAKSRVFAGLATFATVTAVTIPLMATAASAATTSVTVDPGSKTANNRTVAYQGTAADNTHTITGTLANDVGGASTVRYLITAGPNADQANNGATAADGNCTTPTATTFSCTVTNGAGKTGVDTIRVFADVNANQLFDSAEPSDTATKTWSGAPFSVTMTPDADTAAQGSCNPFTVVVKDQGGNSVGAGIRVDVVVTQTSPAPATTASTVTFCDPTATGGPGGTNSQAAPLTTPSATDTANAPAGRRGEYATDASGTVTFGITSSTVSTHTVQAFVENDDPATVQAGDNTLDAGEPNDSSTKSFTAGGAAGVTALDAEPETATRFIGSTHTFTAVLKNAGGDTVSGVTPLADITAGPNAAVTPTCGASNQAGVSSCSYASGTTTGTDTIVVWVQQANAGGTPGPDANEPQDTIQATFVAGAAGTAIDLVCQGTVAGGSAAVTTPAPGSDAAAEEFCISPTSRTTETFTAYVTGPDGPDAGTAPDPIAGVPVNFALNSGGTGTDDVTLSATTVTTDAAGKAVITATNPNPTTSDAYGITATTATNTTTVSDFAVETYAARTTSTVAITPLSATNQVNTSTTLTATVKDQFGDPIANQAITFNVSGRNTRTSTGLTTNGTGQATFTYTDTGPANSNGTDTVNATSGTVTSPNGARYWITEAATVGQVDLDVSGTCNAVYGDNDTKAVALASSNPVCATVRTASGTNVLAGQTVTFTITGVGTFADGTKTATAVTDAAGQAQVTAKSTASGAQNITATTGGKSDTGTLTYAAAAPGSARFIDLKPDTSNIAPGKDNELTAQVTDVYGNPVAGITVDFTETGPGNFANGTSSQSGVTGATGTVTITLSSPAGSTGTETVTAAISATQAAASQCNTAVNTPTAGDKAGNCSDTSTYTFKSASAPTFILGTNVIAAGQFTKVVATGTPGDTVQFLVKGAASTSYTVIATQTLNSNGTTFLNVSPSTSSNYFVRSASGSAAPKFLLVKAVQSINVAKSGTTGVFTGLVKPSLQGRTVIVYGYLTGGHVATLCTTTVKAGGHFACNKPGLTKGATYHVFAQTGADKFNAAGRSGLKDLTI